MAHPLLRPGWIKSLTLPLIAAPMFLLSGPKLVTAACRAGIVGSFPALNSRTDEMLDEWLTQISSELRPTLSPTLSPTHHRPSALSAPYAVNLIVHKSNNRLQENLKRVIQHKVPIVITSLGAVKEVIDSVHQYGGLVFHDVTNEYHARKAASAGVDGLIVVCAGAGGHAGLASPFAIIPRIRSFFDGILILAGAISDGAGIRAAQCLGADLAYMGTRFIATQESQATPAYKQMLVDPQLKSGPPPTFLPIVYSNKISGVHANFLRKSLENVGLNPDDPQGEGLGEENFGEDINSNKMKPWKDIWSAGHGVINIHDIPTVEELVKRLHVEYSSVQEKEKQSFPSKL